MGAVLKVPTSLGPAGNRNRGHWVVEGNANAWSAMTHACTVEKGQKVKVPLFHMTPPST